MRRAAPVMRTVLWCRVSGIPVTAFAFVSHSNAILEEQMESSDFAACTFAVYAPILTAQLLCSPSNFEASLATKVH